MPRTILDELLRKPVEVRANGFFYRGILIEVAEREITLRAPTGYVSIPMERITSVRDPGKKHGKEAPKYIDQSFYTADLPAAKPTVPPSEKKD